VASRSLGTLTLDLIAKIGGFIDGMTKAERVANRKLSDIEKRAVAFGKVMGGAIATGAAAALTGLVAVTKQAIDSADRLNDISERLGVGTEALSAWGYAAEQSGTDLESLNIGLTKLTKNVAAAADQTSKQAKIFKALGVDAIDPVTKSLRDVEDLLPEIASAFKTLNNETLEASLAQELFGKSGANLLQFLNLGADGLSEMEDRARALGIVISEDTANAADEFNDQLANLKAIGSGAGIQLAGELLPALTDIVIQFRDGIQEGGKIAKLIAFIGDQADAAANDFRFLSESVDTFTDLFKVLYGQASNTLSVLKNIASLDFSGAIASFKQFAQGQANLAEVLTREPTKLTAQDKLAQGIKGQLSAAGSPLEFRFTKEGRAAAELAKQQAAAIEAALNAVLAGGGGRKAKGGKSDAEKASEALAKAYESTNEKLKEQIALFGQDGEAAALRYELEHGALSKLDPLKKAELVTLAEKLDLMRDEADVQKELDAQNDAREKSAKAVLESIQAERETLGLSSEQWEIYNNLKRAGVEANTALGQSIIEETKALQAEAKALEPQIAIMDEFRSGLEDTFVDIIQGNKSISDSFKDLFDDLQAQILRWIAKRLIEQAFGAQGTTGQGSWGWIGQLGAALFGGGRAAGGQVLPGQIYRVNENGPELLSMGNRDYLMMGSQGGKVTPSSGMSVGVAVTQNFINPQMNDPRSESQRQQQAAQQLRIASLRNA
jgi:hypothetical protein